MGVRKSPAQLSSTNFPLRLHAVNPFQWSGVSLGFELCGIRFRTGGRSYRVAVDTRPYMIVISKGFKTVRNQDGHSIIWKN